MKSVDLKERIVRHTIENSGNETDRSYLGMSQIWRDEADLVREMATGPSSPLSPDRKSAVYLAAPSVLPNLSTRRRLLSTQ